MLIENMTPLPKMAQVVIDNQFIGLPMLLDEATYWIHRNTRRFPGSVIGWVTAKADVDNAPVDNERFQLIANESVKVGQPVNRADALYWISQVRARALEPGEVVGWVGSKAVETESNIEFTREAV